MNKKQRLRILWRWPLMMFVLVVVFWRLWHIIAGDIPTLGVVRGLDLFLIIGLGSILAFGLGVLVFCLVIFLALCLICCAGIVATGLEFLFSKKTWIVFGSWLTGKA